MIKMRYVYMILMIALIFVISGCINNGDELITRNQQTLLDNQVLMNDNIATIIKNQQIMNNNIYALDQNVKIINQACVKANNGE